MLISFTGENGLPVSLNPAAVVSVQEIPTGVRIELNTRGVVIVRDEYEVVVNMINGV